MRKLPLMIIGISLLFLGLGETAKQVAKLFMNDEPKYQFVTVSERVPAPPEIQEDTRKVVIINQQQEGEFSKVKVRIQPPPPPLPLKESDAKEFSIEGKTDGEPFTITTDSEDKTGKHKIYIFNKKMENPSGEKLIEKRKMDFVISKDKTPE